MTIAHVIVDYQNVHLTAHDAFCPEHEARHLCLIHPVSYAHEVIRQRNLMKGLTSGKSGTPFTPVTLGSVRSFRGLPSNKHDPNGYRRSQAQRSEWTKDRKSTVHYRPLKYRGEGARMTIQEKGIDVLVALELVQVAAAADIQDAVAILAAHDTDQEPALELAQRLAPGRIETTGWLGQKRLNIPGVTMWHTFLGDQGFQTSIDRKDYT